MKRILLIIILIQTFLSLYFIKQNNELREDIRNLRTNITWHMGDIEEKLDYLVNTTD